LKFLLTVFYEIQGSAKATRELQAIIIEHKFKELKVIADCPTRWSASFNMAQRVVELHAPISLYFIKYPKHQALQLSSSEWEELKEICGHLQVFASATTVLSSETDPTAAFMWPIFTRLSNTDLALPPPAPTPPTCQYLDNLPPAIDIASVNQLMTRTDTIDLPQPIISPISNLQDLLRAHVIFHWNTISRQTRLLYSAASFLHPQFKSFSFIKDPVLRAQVKNEAIATVQVYSGT